MGNGSQEGSNRRNTSRAFFFLERLQQCSNGTMPWKENSLRRWESWLLPNDFWDLRVCLKDLTRTERTELSPGHVPPAPLKHRRKFGVVTSGYPKQTRKHTIIQFTQKFSDDLAKGRSTPWMHCQYTHILVQSKCFWEVGGIWWHMDNMGNSTQTVTQAQAQERTRHPGAVIYGSNATHCTTIPPLSLI